MREEVEQAVPVGAVALLQGIDDHDQTAGLHYARHLGDGLRADLLRQLVQQERGDDEVETGVVMGQGFGRGFVNFYPGRFKNCFVQVNIRRVKKTYPLRSVALRAVYRIKTMLYDIGCY